MNQPVANAGYQPFLADVDLIAKDQFDFFGQGACDGRMFSAAGRRRGPRRVIVFLHYRHTHTDDAAFGFRLPHQGFNSRPADWPNRG